MKPISHFVLRGLVIIATLAAFTGMARAHPHVWVTTSSELLYAADGTVTGVRHSWQFDDMFSTYALQGIETKEKGVYTREELAPLAQINVESLKEYDFFTYAKADGQKQLFVQPVDYYLEYKDTALVLHFTLPFKQPFKSRELALDVFDPTFFVDFAFAKTDPIRLVGAPAACKLTVERPKDNPSAAKQLTEENFMSDALEGNGEQFATKITIGCP